MSDVIERNGADALATLVRETVLSGVERRALALRVDRLPPSLATPAHRRRLREAIQPLALADRGRALEMENGRIVVSWRGDAPRLLSETIEAIDLLLQQDPFEAPGVNQLVETFTLPGDALALMALAAESLAAPASAPVAATPPVFEAPMTPEPLDLDLLSRLEAGLDKADLSRFARRRSICHLLSQGLQLAWEERLLSVPDLMADIAPHCDPRSNPWLFRRLTRVLDRRMLSLLSDSRDLRQAGPFGITLNVSSVLNPEFLRFDAAIPASLRGRVVLSFLPADVAADANAFAFARNFARSRSYRIGLRAVTASVLPALDLPALELDFVQLVWSPALRDLAQLPAAGRARWIMGRPCEADAIEWGRGMGVGLYSTKPTV